MSLARRQLLQGGLGLAAGLAGLGLGNEAVQAAAQGAAADPDALTACTPTGDPLERLLAGNRRFANTWQQAARTPSLRRRQALFAQLVRQECFLDPTAFAQGQKPWAALLACADSRVSPDLVFGVSPGEMFEVRSAGNTAFPAGIASLEYAVGMLQVPLIMVMGHSSCGAVTAAMGRESLTPLLQDLVRPIRAALKPSDNLSQAIRANARAAASQLTESSELLRQAQQQGRLRIVASTFDLSTGLVEML